MSIASSTITIYKASDVIRSDTAPDDVSKVWVDTSVDPPVLKTYDSSACEWRAPNELELAAMSELIESHETKFEIIDGKINTLISDTYIEQEDGTTVSTKELYSQVVQKVDSITSTVASVQTDVEQNKENIERTSTTANQTAEKFTWIVESGTDETNFTLTDRTASLVSEYINLNGTVTFGGLSSDIQNKINNAESNSETALQTASESKVLSLSLTSELCSVPSDSDGSNADLSNAYTTASCFFGSEDISNSATYTYSASCATVSQDGRKFTVLSIDADTSYVDITASYAFTDYKGNQSTLSNTKRFTVTKSKRGTTGSPAVTYTIKSSVDTVTRNISNQLSPESITFNFYKQIGDNSAQSAYSGRCIIAESDDGSNWNNKYTSSSNELSCIYTPSSGTISYIRCTLYESGGTSNALNLKTVNVIFDSDSFSGLLAIENDETVIDGSKILTGSIISKSIASETITTDKLASNSITATKLDISSVVSGLKDDGTIFDDINKNISKLESNFSVSIDGVKAEVSAVSQKVDDLDIGSRNYIRNSKTLTFDSYSFVSRGDDKIAYAGSALTDTSTAGEEIITSDRMNKIEEDTASASNTIENVKSTMCI